MLKILAIGNSFSQDAMAYLHDLAAEGGYESKTVNLYIGGCSLKRHCENIESDAPAYSYELNGKATGRSVSVKEALTEEAWDIVTLQQVSNDSGLWDTYEPYLGELSAYVRTYAPSAKLYVHETWAYEKDSKHGAFLSYGSDQSAMYEALKAAYRKAADLIGAGLIRCGDVVQALRMTPEFDYPAGISLCRDGFHMNLAYGRYLTAAVWYETLFGGDITKNPYLPPVDSCGEYDKKLIAMIADRAHSSLSE